MTVFSLYSQSLDFLLTHLGWFWLSAAIIGLFVHYLFELFRFPRWLNILVHLPGTIAHELMHALACLIFSGQLKSFSVLPKKIDETRYELGSVTCGIGWFSAAPVAMAPLLLFLTPFAAAYWVAPSEVSLYHYPHWIGFYLVLILTQSAFPSRQDFKVLFLSPLSIIFWASLIGSVFYFWDEIVSFINSVYFA